MSRHGLRLLTGVKSWSQTNDLLMMVVPQDGEISPLCSRYRHLISR